MQAKLDGAKELHALIRELPTRVATKGLRRALTVGSAPILKAARRGAPKATGNLRRAMSRKVSVKKMAGFAVIGAKRAPGPGGRVASRYVHLVENGTAAHAVPQPKRNRVYHHPGTAGQGFMAAAEASQGPLASRLVVGVLNSTVRIEAKKLGKQ